MYSDLLPDVYVDLEKLFRAVAEFQVLNSEICSIKKIVVDTFYNHCSNAHFTLKLYLLVHIVVATRRTGKLSVLDASLSERYNVRIKTSHERTLTGMKTILEGSVESGLLC